MKVRERFHAVTHFEKPERVPADVSLENNKNYVKLKTKMILDASW